MFLSNLKFEPIDFKKVASVLVLLQYAPSTVPLPSLSKGKKTPKPASHPRRQRLRKPHVKEVKKTGDTNALGTVQLRQLPAPKGKKTPEASESPKTTTAPEATTSKMLLRKERRKETQMNRVRYN